MPRAPPVTRETLPRRDGSSAILTSPPLPPPPRPASPSDACSSPTGQSESLARDHPAHDLGRAAADRLPHALAPELLDARPVDQRFGRAEVERGARDALTHF